MALTVGQPTASGGSRRGHAAPHLGSAGAPSLSTGTWRGAPGTLPQPTLYDRRRECAANTASSGWGGAPLDISHGACGRTSPVFSNDMSLANTSGPSLRNAGHHFYVGEILVGRDETNDVLVCDEEGHNRRLSWRFGAWAVLEGDDQTGRRIGLEHVTDDIDVV